MCFNYQQWRNKPFVREIDKFTALLKHKLVHTGSTVYNKWVLYPGVSAWQQNEMFCIPNDVHFMHVQLAQTNITENNHQNTQTSLHHRCWQAKKTRHRLWCRLYTNMNFDSWFFLKFSFMICEFRNLIRESFTNHDSDMLIRTLNRICTSHITILTTLSLSHT